MASDDSDRAARKLLILDVNGCLCSKVLNDDPRLDKLRETHPNFIERSVYHVFARPGVSDFIDQCFEDYDVAIFSSTTFYNVDPILDMLLTKEQREQLKFIWCRDRTRLDPMYGREEYDYIKKYDTIKMLEDVFANPVINADRHYSDRNTIIVDNELRKVRLNPDHSVMVWNEFSIGRPAAHLVVIKQNVDYRFDQLQSEFIGLS